MPVISTWGGVGWRGGGGGVTLIGSGLSYSYPSGGLKSHKRGLMMHENLHAFQKAATGKSSFATPTRFSEGITYALEQHVYDPVKKQLTVMVFDQRRWRGASLGENRRAARCG